MCDKKDLNLAAVQDAKADGQPYVQQFDEDYEKMTPEERAEVDKMMAQLAEIIDLDDESED